MKYVWIEGKKKAMAKRDAKIKELEDVEEIESFYSFTWSHTYKIDIPKTN